jgi:hypothetical protein
MLLNAADEVAEGGDETQGDLGAARKVWSTPRLILSELKQTEGGAQLGTGDVHSASIQFVS